MSGDDLRDRLAALDGLRGVAALMVVASHASGLGLHLVPGWSLEGIGKPGVYLFFVISAFLLTSQWLRTDPARRFAPTTLGRYLRRRIARIYPLYMLILAIGWALPPPGLGVPLDGPAVWRHLTLQDGQGIYWSIPVEFLYYLVIPPLAWWLGTTRIAAAWRAGVVLAGLGACLLVYPSGQAPLNTITLGYYLPVLVSGSLCAWWLHAWSPSGPAPERPSLRFGPDLLAGAALLLSVPSVLTALGWGDGPATLHRAFLGWGVFWSLLLAGVQTGYLPLAARWMRARALAACGRWCFGLYLLHMPALYLAKRLPLPVSLKGWVGLALALMLAALAYRVIERPAMDAAR